MARMNKATWRGPVPNLRIGGMVSYRLFVLHVQQGTEAGTDAWIHNPAAEVSAHFGSPKVGIPDQWVDTRDTAWAEAAYNTVALSVEHEGYSGESLNTNQLENTAQILAWAHTMHGVPLQATDDPNGSGVIGHGQLGVAGGNHPDCPGYPILAARALIIARAEQIVLGTTVAPPVNPVDTVNLLQKLLNTLGASPQLVIDDHVGPKTKAAFLAYLVKQPDIKQGSTGTAVRVLQAMLTLWGYDTTIDGSDGSHTTASVVKFQIARKLKPDAVVGPKTKAALAS